MSMPTADDLFRPTASDDEQPAASQENPEPAAPRKGATVRAVSSVPDDDGSPAADPDQDASPAPAGPEATTKAAKRRSSGRVRHDEKMTVYVTADELLDIEHARLSLRRDHGLAVDRGRLVREALAIVLADLDHSGSDSELVRRLLG